MVEENVSDDLRDQGQFFYNKRPTTALIELYRVIGFTNHRLANISQPTLVINTQTAEGSVDFIFDKLTSAQEKRKYTMNSSSLRWYLQPAEAAPAFNEIEDFIQSTVKKG